MMDNNISVIIGTFGSDAWKSKADSRANFSVSQQSLIPEHVYVHLPNGTLAEARNSGASNATKDFLCFLDADDFLDKNFIYSMNQAIRDSNFSSKVLFQPATKTFRSDENPIVIPKKNIFVSNYLIIGTVVHRQTFLDAGGFHELDAFEDWDLWIRCFLSGCSSVSVSSAIYEVANEPNSRNKNDPKILNKAYNSIRAKYR
jgi:glycosyltransferase involved in cell wall biosynthesis